MYQLYIANKNYSSWSLRPWILMKQRGIEFEENLVPFDEGSSWESFRSFSPTGLVPCLLDGSTAVWDSLAIAEYLAERHDGVWPVDGEARTWARCAAAEMHSGFTALRNQCPMNVGLKVRLHERPAELEHDLSRLAELWQQGLQRFGGPWLAGEDFTAVDAFYAPVAFRIATFGLDLPDSCRQYSQRLLELPAMKSWSEAARVEPWRETDHEEEIAASGEILSDARTAGPESAPG